MSNILAVDGGIYRRFRYVIIEREVADPRFVVRFISDRPERFWAYGIADAHVKARAVVNQTLQQTTSK